MGMQWRLGHSIATNRSPNENWGSPNPFRGYGIWLSRNPRPRAPPFSTPWVEDCPTLLDGDLIDDRPWVEDCPTLPTTSSSGVFPLTRRDPCQLQRDPRRLQQVSLQLIDLSQEASATQVRSLHPATITNPKPWVLKIFP